MTMKDTQYPAEDDVFKSDLHLYFLFPLFSFLLTLLTSPRHSVTAYLVNETHEGCFTLCGIVFTRQTLDSLGRIFSNAPFSPSAFIFAVFFHAVIYVSNFSWTSLSHVSHKTS